MSQISEPANLTHIIHDFKGLTYTGKNINGQKKINIKPVINSRFA
jgi:hypothetical protein